MLETIRAAISSPSTWIVLILNIVLIAGIWRFGLWLTTLLTSHVHQRILNTVRIAWSVFMLYTLLAVLVHLLGLVEVQPLYDHGEALGIWFKASVGQIATVLILATLAWQLIGVVTNRIVPSETFTRRTVRVQTLKGVIESTLRIAIVIVAGISVLQNVGINATTLLAGVSVLGLAISFGAQSLVKDVFNGFFILLEDQYGVGDVITINNGGLSGSVENLNLRVTILRTLDGTVNIIPNGQILTVSVATKDWARFVGTVTVPLNSDVDTALRVLERVAHEMYADPTYSHIFLGAPDVQGVTKLTVDSLEMRVLFKVLPKHQYPFGWDFNRRVKVELEQAGIFPQAAAAEDAPATPAGSPVLSVTTRTDLNKPGLYTTITSSAPAGAVSGTSPGSKPE